MNYVDSVSYIHFAITISFKCTKVKVCLLYAMEIIITYMQNKEFDFQLI